MAHGWEREDGFALMTRISAVVKVGEGMWDLEDTEWQARRGGGEKQKSVQSVDVDQDPQLKVRVRANEGYLLTCIRLPITEVFPRSWTYI